MEVVVFLATTVGIMATKIKETPILTGKSAREFLKKAEENKRKRVPKKDYERAAKAWNEFGGFVL